MSTNDHRMAAHSCVQSLIKVLRARTGGDAILPIVTECEALARAIEAFHMEGIRFRMYNVDRLLSQAAVPEPDALALFAESRQQLEAAGFHTRSHKAPG